MNVFCNTIVFVKDIQKSKEFYTRTIGLKVAQEYDTIVFFENHFVIHNVKSILNTVFKRSLFRGERLQGCKNILIYLETDHLEEAYQKIEEAGCKIIHSIEKQAWGQRVFRFYDPDKHMVEIGEMFRKTADDFGVNP